MSLRSAGRDGFTIVDVSSGELLGTVDAARAYTTTHEGAVYLHGGRSFEVRALDLDARRALVHPFDGEWYTQPKTETDTRIERLLDRREQLGVTLSFGTVTVTERVLAYQRKRLSDHEALDLVGLDLPETSFTTQALWYELPPAIAGHELPLEALLGSLHAAEHSQIAVLPLLAMCDRWDIGGLSTNLHPQTGGPTIFIYDGHPGGIGITRRGFLLFDALVEDAHRLVSECPCAAGCPSCVQSPKCGNLNEPLPRPAAASSWAGCSPPPRRRSGATTSPPSSVQQRDRGRRVLRQGRELLELDDVVDLRAHGDVRDALEDDLDHHGHAVLLGEPDGLGRARARCPRRR